MVLSQLLPAARLCLDLPNATRSPAVVAFYIRPKVELMSTEARAEHSTDGGRTWGELKVGDPITVSRDGRTITQIVSEIGYRSAEPAIYKRLTRWEELVRRFTPRRFRKPIPVVREARPPEFTIETISRGEAVMREALEKLGLDAPTGTKLDGLRPRTGEEVEATLGNPAWAHLLPGMWERDRG